MDSPELSLKFCPEGNDSSGNENRDRSDRRKKPTSFWGAFPRAGRRMAARRGDEHRLEYFVDRFSSAMFLAIVLLIGASLVDAFLTIQLLQQGAKEINPVMDRLLEQGVHAFLMGKYVLTVGGLPLLLIFKNYYLFGTRLRVAYLIPIAVVLYVALIGYQLDMMGYRILPW